MLENNIYPLITEVIENYQTDHIRRLHLQQDGIVEFQLNGFLEVFWLFNLFQGRYLKSKCFAGNEFL